MYQKKNYGTKNWFVKEATLIMIALAIGLVGTVYMNVAKGESVDEIQKGLAANMIRFHVIANSDSDEDQALKLKVRDAVLNRMSDLLEVSSDIDESREILIENKDFIREIAREVIIAEGEDYQVEVSLEYDFFPIKAYGDIVLPTGEYEALKIKIGDAKGKNWWCVMFPPLCFVDVTHGIVPDEAKEDLKNILTEEEYNAILNGRSNDIPVKVRFKLVDVMNDNQKQKDKKTGLMGYLFGWAF